MKARRSFKFGSIDRPFYVCASSSFSATILVRWIATTGTEERVPAERLRSVEGETRRAARAADRAERARLRRAAIAAREAAKAGGGGAEPSAGGPANDNDLRDPIEAERRELNKKYARQVPTT